MYSTDTIRFDLSPGSTIGFCTLLNLSQAFDPQHTEEVKIQTLLGLFDTLGIKINRKEVASVLSRDLRVCPFGKHELRVAFNKIVDNEEQARILFLTVDKNTFALKGGIGDEQNC